MSDWDAMQRNEWFAELQRLKAENERLKTQLASAVRLEVYEAAVKGRQEFRAGMAEARKDRDALKRANDEHFEGSKAVLKENVALKAQLAALREAVARELEPSGLRTMDALQTLRSNLRLALQQAEAPPSPSDTANEMLSKFKSLAEAEYEAVSAVDAVSHDPPSCASCGVMYSMELDDEPTLYCDSCAHDQVDALLEENLQLREEIVRLRKSNAGNVEAAAAETFGEHNRLTQIVGADTKNCGGEAATAAPSLSCDVCRQPDARPSARFSENLCVLCLADRVRDDNHKRHMASADGLHPECAKEAEPR